MKFDTKLWRIYIGQRIKICRNAYDIRDKKIEWGYMLSKTFYLRINTIVIYIYKPERHKESK